MSRRGRLPRPALAPLYGMAAAFGIILLAGLLVDRGPGPETTISVETTQPPDGDLQVCLEPPAGFRAVDPEPGNERSCQEVSDPTARIDFPVAREADGPSWTLIGLTAIAAAVGVLLATSIARPGGTRPQHRPDPPAGRPLVRPRDPAPREQAAQLVLPVDAQAPESGPWWGRDSPTGADARPPAPPPPAPDLATYRRSARIVACPRCGAFRIDVAHADAGFAFRCRVDDHTWTWRPGTAWPATVVASRRRTEQ